jgi:thymidylate synthase
MVREGRVELAVTMRSNDAYKGLPHDVFSFTMIQEIIARVLGYEPGVYSHFVGSLHLYNESLRASRQYLDEGWQPTLGAAMPPMPLGDPMPSIKIVQQAEEAIRRGRKLDSSVNGLPPFWRDIVRLLEIYGLSTRREGKKIPKIRRSMADSVYKEYITKREPPRQTAPRSGQPSLPFKDPPEDGADSDDI